MSEEQRIFIKEATLGKVQIKGGRTILLTFRVDLDRELVDLLIQKGLALKWSGGLTFGPYNWISGEFTSQEMEAIERKDYPINIEYNGLDIVERI